MRKAYRRWNVNDDPSPDERRPWSLQINIAVRQRLAQLIQGPGGKDIFRQRQDLELLQLLDLFQAHVCDAGPHDVRVLDVRRRGNKLLQSVVAQSSLIEKTP